MIYHICIYIYTLYIHYNIYIYLSPGFRLTLSIDTRFFSGFVSKVYHASQIRHMETSYDVQHFWSSLISKGDDDPDIGFDPIEN